ncbi:hypothetical protein NQ315_000436 [Exocentrus adspersus]|uniref:Protein quiver n=1 Tax=Exocentrus adspersus TaxID=1586481 RepID=A0AAV8VLN0_9CUCU|nr:hypothetical protein NQ315_000436 [Exocentrus adspersus]
MPEGYALRCFTCTSLELQSSCSNASNETTNAVVCDPYCPVCVTVTWNDSVKTITVRSCAAFTDVCEIYNTTYGSMDSCTTCDTDLCNGFP